MSDAFRELLASLEAAGELLRIPDLVDPRYEVCAYCRHAADDDGPALLFERLAGHDMRAVANLFGSRRRIAHALGTTEPEIGRTVRERLRQRIPPVRIEAKDAPCKEVIVTGDAVDL